MGSFFSKVFLKVFRRKEMRILILGLENAGKTSFLYQFLFKKQFESIPTIGFNIESFQFQNVNLQVWDLGGQKALRQHWNRYFPNTQGLVYIIDSSDHARLDLAREELIKVLQEEELRKVPLLVLAHKQDIPESISHLKLKEYLGVSNFERHAEVFPTSTVRQKSIEEALSWLVQEMSLDD